MNTKNNVFFIWVAMVALVGVDRPVFSQESGLGQRPSDLTVAELPLEDVIKVDDQFLAVAGSLDVSLPPLSPRPGKVVVLRFRAVSYTPKPAGWAWNAGFALNGNTLGRHTDGGDERLIGRDAVLRARGLVRQVFSGFMVLLMFAPDVDTGDAMIPDGQGASFALNISDVARAVDGNMLRISNIRRSQSVDPAQDLIVRDIEIGWMDKSLLPTPPNRLPSREPMNDSVSKDGMELSLGIAGGFSVKGKSGVELLVETALTVDKEAEASLIASDAASAGVELTATREGPDGYCVTATWPDISLVRHLQLKDGVLQWKERWTNTGKTLIALPFQHRLFLRDELAGFRLAGDLDNSNIESVSKNPTVYLGSKQADGNGVGITMENDWLRLLAGLRRSGGVGEIYSLCTALQPGRSIDFSLTVSLVEDGGGYWTFINDVRKRWGVNGGTADRPLFWNWSGKSEEMTEEVWERAFGHLGPVVVAAWPPGLRHPWVRKGHDIPTVLDGRYPKLPTDAPRTPGKTPDLDVDAFLTFAHREEYWKSFAEYVAMAHRAVPNVRIIPMMHPGLEVVYLPMADRWPQAKDALRNAEGGLFNSTYYSAAYLADHVNEDWQMSYNVPTADSTYLKILLRDVIRSMDECGSDGMYIDEFSWAGSVRGYSRYNYAHQDGYSADLDAEGKVIRLKSDNAYTTGPGQRLLVEAIRDRGKYFIGNGNASLRSINNLHALRFQEGGNGVGRWATTHLATVPLILANFGDNRTREGTFTNVKIMLENGCIYSPKDCNLILEGDDNFVCKLYPITIQTIGPGLVKANERLITTHSGAFDWPGRKAAIVLYAYDKNGDLMNRKDLPEVQADAGGQLKITVPPDGMVIAEIAGQ